MSEPVASPHPLPLPSLRGLVARHRVGAFLVLLYGFAVGLALVPALTQPSWLPRDDHLYGVLVNVLGCAASAFAVTAIAGGRRAVRDLARRCLRWRVPLRWYAVALLGMPAATLAVCSGLYGVAPLRSLAENWLLVLTSFLPTLALMIVAYNVTEEIGFTGFLFATLQERRGPLRAALLTTAFFWLWHLPTFVIDSGSWAFAGILMGVVLLPHVASRILVAWLYNATGASVLIAGLFHATFNSTVNPTGFAIAVLGIPQEEAFVIVNLMVVLAAAAVALGTRGALGRGEGGRRGHRGGSESDPREGGAQP